MPLKSVYNAPWFVKVVFVISLFVVFFIAGIAYKHITDLSKSQSLVVHTYKVNVELEQILSYLKDAETGQRGFIITRDSLLLQPYLKSRNNLNNSIAELKVLIEDNQEQQKNLRELSIAIDQRLDNFELASSYIFNKPNNAAQFDKVFLLGNDYMQDIRNKLNEMIALENGLLEERQASYRSTLKFTPVFLYGFVIIVLIFMYLAYAKINTNLEELRLQNHQLNVFKESTKQSEIINKHGSWRWNVDEDSFHFSDNLFRLLGEEPNAFEHTIENFMHFVHPEDVKKLSDSIERMRHEKDLPFVTYRVIHNDGSIHYLKAYGKSTIDRDGKTQLLGTTTDVTEDIAHYNTLELRNQELELNNKELAAFNYVASHDLQEPLRKIQTFLSRLKEKESDRFSESGKTYMARIDVAAGRMRALIDDLLQYSRTNKADAVLKSSNINTLISDAQQDLAEAIVEHDAQITVANMPKMLVVPFQIQQLFANLLNNSLKYRAKERAVIISIEYVLIAKSEDERIASGHFAQYHKISFTDNGIGFEQQYAEKIFTLFSRLHNKDEYSGTGIGLSICKKITDNHAGFIFAKAAPDQGATFEIFLPKRQ